MTGDYLASIGRTFEVAETNMPGDDAVGSIPTEGGERGTTTDTRSLNQPCRPLNVRQIDEVSCS